MTQEEKILLLKDICTRIPYGLKASVRGSIEENITFDILSVATNFKVFVENRFISVSHYEDIEVVRPYLRPMSSMTEKESTELSNIISEWSDKELFYLTEEPFLEYALSRINYSINPRLFDWLNEHHFDYRGFIEKGLALEAPEYMYNNKKD
jgi:hypothetical protein